VTKPTLAAQRLRQARKDNGLTQPQLAEALGVTEQTIRNWESGTHRASRATLHMAAELLAVEESWLAAE
jgi:transcriptional regulator with XRE-family HTH domain